MGQTSDRSSFAKARKSAHSLKSSSAYIGAQRLAALCKDMQAAACNCDSTEPAGRLVSMIAIGYHKVGGALLNILSAHEKNGG
jgi:HPt (histidine-containing phosphotransfer) domain-containing protein